MSIAGLDCPYCRRPTVWEGNEHRPFCSERCRLLDLGAWADGSYRVPERQAVSVDDEDDNVSQNNKLEIIT
jgi:endogenous inhibitor of DNA gyrase (YacG/DUF329 family)